MIKITCELYNNPDFHSTYFADNMKAAEEKKERLSKCKHITKITLDDMTESTGKCRG